MNKFYPKRDTYKTGLTNNDRAIHAEKALRLYHLGTGVGDPQDALTDLIGDLLHLSDKWKLDFGKAIEGGSIHYEAER